MMRAAHLLGWLLGAIAIHIAMPFMFLIALWKSSFSAVLEDIGLMYEDMGADFMRAWRGEF